MVIIAIHPINHLFGHAYNDIDVIKLRASQNMKLTLCSSKASGRGVQGSRASQVNTAQGYSENTWTETQINSINIHAISIH